MTSIHHDYSSRKQVEQIRVIFTEWESSTLSNEDAEKLFKAKIWNLAMELPWRKK